MRRSVVYTRWKAGWWTDQADYRPDISDELREGLRAYALQHAAEEADMANRWEAIWQPLRDAAAKFLRSELEDSATIQSAMPAPQAPRKQAFLDINLEEEEDDQEDFDDDEVY